MKMKARYSVRNLTSGPACVDGIDDPVKVRAPLRLQDVREVGGDERFDEFEKGAHGLIFIGRTCGE